MPFAVASSQSARGLIRDEGASPLGGAIVLVVDSAGATTGHAMADSAGRFVVGLGPATAKLRVLRIGYRPIELSANPTRDTSFSELRLSRIPPVLDAVRVTEGSLCPGSTDRGLAFQVLEQVRAGLLGQVVSIEAGAVDARALLYRRTVNSTSRIVESQTAEMRTGRSLRPFVSAATPKAFAEHGYMQEDAGGRTFGAVDSDVLLSEYFAATHCFQLTTRDAGHPGEIGLAFTPVSGRDTLVEVAGTVWLEQTGRELHSIEFRYVNVEPAAMKAGVGGSVAFRTASNGQVLIEHWRLTLPVLVNAPGAPAIQAGRRRESRTDLRVSEIRETGGLLLGAKWSGGREWRLNEGSGVSGSIRFSQSDRPVANAVVSIDGATNVAVTDSAGAFLISPMPPGRYKVIATDTAFSRYLKPRTSTQLVDVRLAALTPTLLHLDPPDTIRIRATLIAAESKQRTVVGIVTDTGNQPVKGADIRVRGLTTVVTDAAGRFQLTGAPRDPILIEARRLGFAPMSVALGSGGDTAVTLMLAPVTQALAAVNVTERKLSSGNLRGFDERMRARARGAGGGVFITADEIEQRSPNRTTAIFSNIPGIHVLKVGPFNYSLFGVGRSLSGPPDGNCEATVFVDGVRVKEGGDVLREDPRTKKVILERGVPIDQVVAPGNIAGIEVYASPVTAPTQFQMVNNGCSIILIWTKTGTR
jgi:hypothetical protein